MNYNFDTIVNRIGTNSVKYDFAHERGKPEDVLPMWVADMDFTTPPEVLEDIMKAAAHGIYGYTEPSEAYYNAVADWFASRFGYHALRREIVKTPCVVFALAQAVKAFTEPGEAVIVQTPVYHPFFKIVRNNGRKLVTNPLVYENSRYTIDFGDFERKIAENSVRLFLLCSPHNPGGRVWTRGELETLRDICARHSVIIVSDEIHADLVWSNCVHTHTCFGCLSEDAIIATAPSKTFNLAGLQCSNIFVKNAKLREKLAAQIARSGYSQLNALGIAACQSAYEKGAPWLEALKSYISESIFIAEEYLETNIPGIKLMKPEGTYLLWLDFSEYGLTPAELEKRITHGAKLWLSPGTLFGADGEGFMRLNIACPHKTLITALERLKHEFAA